MIGEILADHSWGAPRGQEETHPGFRAEELQKPVVINLQGIAHTDVEQGLNGAAVYGINKDQTNQEWNEAQHCVSGKQTGLKQIGESVAGEYSKPRPLWREDSAIGFVGALIDCH